jgi:hypothetical protein
MKKAKKLMILGVLIVFLMACSISTTPKKAASPDTSSSGDMASNQATEGQPSSGDQSSGQPSDALPFSVSIPTDVKIVNGILTVPKIITFFNPTTKIYKTYLVLEDTSTDKLDLISEFNYKITWYDENKQAVDQWENTYNIKLIPQEKVLFELWPNKSKVADQKIVSAVFEVSQVTSIKSFWEQGALDKLGGLPPISHPIISVIPDNFTFDYAPLILGSTIPRVTTPVKVQSTLTVQVQAEVIGIYLNSKGEIIGVGMSDPIMVDPKGSGNADVIGYDMTEKPEQAEYFVKITSPGDILEAAYPDYYK